MHARAHTHTHTHTHTHIHTHTHTCMQCPPPPSTLHHRRTLKTNSQPVRLTQPCDLHTGQYHNSHSNLSVHLGQIKSVSPVSSPRADDNNNSADLYNIMSLINSLTVLYNKIAYKLKSCDRYAKNVMRMLLNIRYNW